MRSKLDWALYLARLGYYVYPMAAGTKIAVKDIFWCEMSTRDPDEIEAWWSKFPDDNVGIDCDKSELLALDFDSPAAFGRFSQLWQRHEGQKVAASTIPVIATTRPTGGWQLYFNQPDPRVGCPKKHQLGPDVDIKGVGGTVVAPGGTITGRAGAYELLQGGLASVPNCPEWLAGTLRPRRPRYAQPRARWITPSTRSAENKLRYWCRQIEMAPEGDQNNTINTAACVLFHYCPPLDIEYVRDELEYASERGNHPERRYKPSIRSGLTHSWDPEKCPFKH